MTDIALNYVGQTGDIDLTGHRLNLATGTQAIEQQCRIRSRFFEGSWSLDERQGIPYYRAILIKAPDLALVDSIYRQTYLGVPGISSITSLSTEIDPATRTLSVTFQARMDTGEPLNFGPFTIEI